MVARPALFGALGAFGALASLGLAELSPASTEAPACLAEVELVPARAVVGQQVLYRVRIARRPEVARVEWEIAPRFPEFRAEWLPGRTEERERRERGVLRQLREEHRAIFAARPGRLRIPEATLRCTLSSGDDEAAPRAERVLIPAVELQVELPPISGQPAGFGGLVGPLRVKTAVDRNRLTLGESIRLSVMLRGGGNLWIAEPPLADADFLDTAEVFAEPAELDMDVGESLQVRRFFRFELVPRREGVLHVPPLRFPYFDPASGRYALAASEAIEVRVAGRPQRGEAAAGNAASETRDDDHGDAAASDALDRPPDGDGASATNMLTFAFALLVGFGIGFALLRRRRNIWQEVDDELAKAKRAARDGDPIAEAAALAAALRAALTRRNPNLAGLDAAGLRAQGAAAAAEHLEALDWLRYSGDVGHPDRDAVIGLVEEQRRKQGP